MMKTLLLVLLSFAFVEAKTFEQAFNIQTIKPKMQMKKITKSYYATTSYDEKKIYELVLRFEGNIENLEANELYKSVKKGERLFDIYSKEIYTLKKELESTKNLLPLNATILEKLRLYELDKRAIDSKEAAVPHFSKYSGKIIQKNIYEGSYAKAGGVLLKIVDDSYMWVIAKVYQRDIEFISEGMRAVVDVEGLIEPIVAKVGKIYPKINKEDLTFDVRLDVKNPNSKIFPDMFAKVSFSKNLNAALTLPKDALIKRGDKFYVFTKISQSEYEPKEIEAEYIGGYYRILSGIDESSEVAQNALFLLDSDAVTNGSYMSEEW
ncbi:MAG: efflux RND transporter periplasmic adaptor subunit [Sulfurimonas sp.]|uniref:efflux RND transporter periplasmic adaptor subunit n=1 Tax=Sulfurimonas sp. TaxID=2022749 RepID=UPI003D09CEC6